MGFKFNDRAARLSMTEFTDFRQNAKEASIEQANKEKE